MDGSLFAGGGAPGDIPPCIRHRPFAIAGAWHEFQLRVRAPHRGLRCMGNLLRILLALRAAAVFQRIDDADHPLATRMDMHMSDLDGLLVAAPATPVLVQCLDQLELQAQQSSAITPVNFDVRILQMPLAQLKELEAGESSCSDLNSKQGL